MPRCANPAHHWQRLRAGSFSDGHALLIRNQFTFVAFVKRVLMVHPLVFLLRLGRILRCGHFCEGGQSPDGAVPGLIQTNFGT